MRIPIRLTFAVLLWAAALVVPALYVLHLQSPSQAVTVALQGRHVLGQVFLYGILAAVAAAMLYPPFLPRVRLLWRRTKSRMSVDQAPMRRALEDMKHFENAARHIEVARVTQALGNPGLALPHSARAVELEPDSMPARYLLGCVLREAGQHQLAIDHLGRVADEDPSHAFGEVLVELGGALLAAGRHAEALAVLQRHTAEHGARRKTRYWMARAFRAVGDGGACHQALVDAAAAPKESERLTDEDALYRARARVGLWTWGRG